MDRHGINCHSGSRGFSFNNHNPAKLHKQNGRQSISFTQNHLRDAGFDKERLQA